MAIYEDMKSRWDIDCTYYETDFLQAALQFQNIDIKTALESKNKIIRIFAILDKRVGKRTLCRIQQEGSYLEEPDWVRQFYKIRFAAEAARIKE